MTLTTMLKLTRATIDKQKKIEGVQCDEDLKDKETRELFWVEAGLRNILNGRQLIGGQKEMLTKYCNIIIKE